MSLFRRVLNLDAPASPDVPVAPDAPLPPADVAETDSVKLAASSSRHCRRRAPATSRRSRTSSGARRTPRAR